MLMQIFPCELSLPVFLVHIVLLLHIFSSMSTFLFQYTKLPVTPARLINRTKTWDWGGEREHSWIRWNRSSYCRENMWEVKRMSKGDSSSSIQIILHLKYTSFEMSHCLLDINRKIFMDQISQNVHLPIFQVFYTQCRERISQKFLVCKA